MFSDPVVIQLKRGTVIDLPSSGRDDKFRNASIDITNEPRTVKDPIIPDTFSFFILVPKRPLIKKPINGKTVSGRNFLTF